MSLRNLHPDLKLGLVLVAAAALLDFDDSYGLFALVVAERLTTSPEAFGWQTLAAGIGGLAIVGVAIWVDRRPPHTIMAAGAVAVAFGLIVLLLTNSFPASLLGAFVTGVGGSAAGSLVFYSIAAKGATRYRGTVIGALGLVFTLPLGVGRVGPWTLDLPVQVLVICALTLTGATVLALLLPRVFAGWYEPGPTLRETLSLPSVRRSAAWTTAVFFMAALVRTAGYYLPSFVMIPASNFEEVKLPFQTVPIFSAIGILLWGIASDFYPARRLFLLAALLTLAALAAFWPFFGYSASAVEYLAFFFVSGGLICLPWLLMAELLPPRHFAKMALGMLFVGSFLGAGSGTTLLTTVMFFWGSYIVVWFFLAAGIILAIVASRLPGPPANETPAG